MNTSRSTRWLLAASVILFLISIGVSGYNAYVAFASPLQQAPIVPTTVGFQGYLTDDSGIPVDGPVTLHFRLYDAATNGVVLWEEIHADVPVTQGLYNVQLGANTPLDSQDFKGERWLGIEVVTNPTEGEMTPRIPISAVPWAMNATGLMGYPVANAVPQPNQVLGWDGVQWAPTTLQSVPYFTTGTYVGNGQDNRWINGLGFSPTAVMIMRGGSASVVRTIDMVGDASCLVTGTCTLTNANMIQALGSDGFQVGTSTSVNQNTIVYYYLAWGE